MTQVIAVYPMRPTIPTAHNCCWVCVSQLSDTRDQTTERLLVVMQTAKVKERQLMLLTERGNSDGLILNSV